MEGLNTQKDLDIACDQAKLSQEHLIVDANDDMTPPDFPSIYFAIMHRG